MQIIKKDGTTEQYNEQKIIDACNKAARRAMVNLSDEDYQVICNAVWEKLVENDLEETEIYESWIDHEAKDTGVNIMDGEQNE